MAIIVEDGSNVANANSFVTRAEAIAYALLRGITLANDATTDVLLIKAMDYLESKRTYYVGKFTYDFQLLSWPRSGVYIDGLAFPEDEIPQQLKNAQMQLAIYASKGIDLLPSVSDKFVVQESIGPISTTYSEKVNVGSAPIMPLVDAMLAQLIEFGGVILQVVRV